MEGSEAKQPARRTWIALVALAFLGVVVALLLMRGVRRGVAGQDAKPRVLTSEGARVRGLSRSAAAQLGAPAATWVPIYYESIDAVTEAVGHQPLRHEDLADGQQEVRVWVGFGITGPMEYLRLRATQELVRGELYLWWSTRYGGGPVDFVREHFASEPVQQGIAAGACRARFSVGPEWGQLLDLMEAHQLWSLPDPSTLQGEVQMLDGTGVCSMAQESWWKSEMVSDTAPTSTPIRPTNHGPRPSMRTPSWA